MKKFNYPRFLATALLVCAVHFISFSQWNKINYPELPPAFSEIRQIGGSLIATAFSLGVYRSDDNGDSWYAIVEGLPENESWTSLAGIGNNIFISTTRAVAYKSQNLGESWEPIDMGLPTAITLREIDAHNDQLYSCGTFGIIKSDDLGISWDTLSNLGLPASVRAISITDNALFASGSGTISGGVFMSTDGGLEWTKISENVAGGVSDIEVIGGRLFAFFLTPDLIYYTDDNGTWTAGSGISVPFISQFVSIGSNIFACGSGAFYKSADNGNSWQDASEGIPITTFSRSIVEAPNGNIVGSTFSGMYVSSNSGENWQASNNGIVINPAFFKDMLFHQNKFFLTGGFTLFNSDDEGNTWNEDLDGMPVDPRPNDLASQGGAIYAIGFLSLIKSEDNGDNWVDISDALPASFISTLKADESGIYIGGFTGLFHSTNGGTVWTELAPDISLNAEDIGFKDNYIFAGDDGGGFYRADKNILDWEFVGNGLPANEDIIEITSNESGVYLAMESGIYFSADLGGSWELLDNMLPNVSEIETLLATDEFIVAGINNNVFFSLDGDVQWQDITDGLPEEILPRKFIIRDNDIYVGSHLGIWKRSISDFFTDTKEIEVVANLIAFPNPAKSIFYINTNQINFKKGTLSVFSENGQKVFFDNNPIISETYPIDLTGQPAGVYFIELKDGNKKWTGKVLIQ